MIANNDGQWSLMWNDILHTWTTGNDYDIEVEDDVIMFDSNAGTHFTMPRAVASGQAEMFESLFGISTAIAE